MVTIHGAADIWAVSSSRETAEAGLNGSLNGSFGDEVSLSWSPEVHARSLRMVGTRPTSRRLTDREREVLQLAADGRSTREIAELLFLSPGTIKVHFHHIYGKLGSRDRASAVANGIRSGLID